MKMVEKHKTNGFTMVEIVIMLGIFITISAMVLVSFPSVSASINVQRSAQGLALVLRRAQNQALAVREVQGLAGPVISPGVGVMIDLATPTLYRMFADMNANRVYDAPADIIIETINFERGARFTAMTDQAGFNHAVLNVVFTSPEAQLTIYNASASIGESALIRFGADAIGVVRLVRVRTSGQIAIE